MTDSCIISKEQLSQKEMGLKMKLYGASINERVKFKVDTDYENAVKNKQIKASPQKVVQHHQTQLKAVTD